MAERTMGHGQSWVLRGLLPLGKGIGNKFLSILTKGMFYLNRPAQLVSNQIFHSLILRVRS